MNTIDKYLTVKGLSKAIYRDRGSRFLAFAMPVNSAADAKNFIDQYKKEYHDAKHHCYAYVIGPSGNITKQSDDGEPSGTAGRPLLGQINARNLTNTLVVVVRYFGGTLLGTGGLINAYKTSASEALDNAEIIECYRLAHLRIRFPYSGTNDVMRILNSVNADIEKQEFAEDCFIQAGIRFTESEKILNRLRESVDIRVDIQPDEW